MQTSFLSSFFHEIVPLMFTGLFHIVVDWRAFRKLETLHYYLFFFRSLYSSFSSKGYFKWWSLLSVIKLAVWPQLWNGNSCVAIVSILFQYLCSVEATQSSGRPVWYINEEGKNLQFSFFCASISNASDKWNGLKLNGL